MALWLGGGDGEAETDKIEEDMDGISVIQVVIADEP